MNSIEALVQLNKIYFSESAKMAMTKVSPSRKLTGNNDSFDDFWFQVTCIYSRDEAFKQIFDDPYFTWQASDVQNRGLGDKLKPFTGPIICCVYLGPIYDLVCTSKELLNLTFYT